MIEAFFSTLGSLVTGLGIFTVLILTFHRFVCHSKDRNPYQEPESWSL